MHNTYYDYDDMERHNRRIRRYQRLFLPLSDHQRQRLIRQISRRVDNPWNLYWGDFAISRLHNPDLTDAYIALTTLEPSLALTTMEPSHDA